MKPRGELAIVLHTHMPYVEGFGTWPFGEEWLWEAIATSYLPLLDELGRAPVTLSLTPVLCDQLEAPGAIGRCIEFLEQIRPESHRLDVEAFRRDDLLERAMLRSVDDAIRSMVATISARGELDRTVIVFLTDNGYEFGLHRLAGKRYPYAPSIGLPFAIRAPWSIAQTDPTLVSNVDLASTISDLAQVRPELPQDGISLVPALHGRAVAARPGVWLDWGGDANVPAWSGVRTARYTYVRNGDGTEELYRNADDPLQLRNLASDPRERDLLDRLQRLTDSLAVPEVGR